MKAEHWDPLLAVGNIIGLSSLVPLVLFAALYFFRSPWWKTDLGVALLMQKLGFIFVFGIIFVGLFAHDWEYRGALRIVLYAIVALSLWLDLGNLIRYQRKYPVSAMWVRAPSAREIFSHYVRRRNDYE